MKGIFIGMCLVALGTASINVEQKVCDDLYD